MLKGYWKFLYRYYYNRIRYFMYLYPRKYIRRFLIKDYWTVARRRWHYIFCNFDFMKALKPKYTGHRWSVLNYHPLSNHILYFMFPEDFQYEFSIYMMTMLTYMLFIYYFGFKMSLIHYNSQYLWTYFRWNSEKDDFSWLDNPDDNELLDEMIEFAYNNSEMQIYAGEAIKVDPRIEFKQSVDSWFFLDLVDKIKTQQVELENLILTFIKKKRRTKKNKKKRKLMLRNIQKAYLNLNFYFMNLMIR